MKYLKSIKELFDSEELRNKSDLKGLNKNTISSNIEPPSKIRKILYDKFPHLRDMEFINGLPYDVVKAVDKSIDYFTKMGIEYSVEEQWSPVGMIRYIITKKNPVVLEKLKSFFKNVKNKTVIKFVRDDMDDDIYINIIDPKDYENIISNEIYPDDDDDPNYGEEWKKLL